MPVTDEFAQAAYDLGLRRPDPVGDDVCGWCGALLTSEGCPGRASDREPPLSWQAGSQAVGGPQTHPNA